MPKNSRPRQNAPAVGQRNALAPGLIAAMALLLGVVVLDGGGFTIVQFVVSILALIVSWFAVQAHQWWWLPVFIAIAVVWNPVVPLPFEGQWWLAAQFAAAFVFILAGILIKVPRTAATKASRAK
ncbi:DUF6804 family protein [Agromyces sp. Marseille-Q5079]|uniref:DUF6804 family protein n=1 Tax=Agromyces sp. Marseille-Q5079 TaxID=3439059 RepID=UPI003D9C9245